MLQGFLSAHTAVIIARARQKVAARTAPLPTEEPLRAPTKSSPNITIDSAALSESADGTAPSSWRWASP